MKDRILKFLESEHLSPAEFADKIGVQRSSMSHILNGRNYPSAAFIQKMLQAFPMVNSRWLLIGEGKMNLSSGENIVPTQKENEATRVSSLADTERKTIQEQEAHSAMNLSIGPVTGNQMDIQFEQPNNSKEEAIKDKEPANEVKQVYAENNPLSATISENSSPKEKEIEQILFFYKDKTFRIYRPS